MTSQVLVRWGSFMDLAITKMTAFMRGYEEKANGKSHNVEAYQV